MNDPVLALARAMAELPTAEVRAMVMDEAERCVGDLPEALTGYDANPALARLFIRAVIDVLERKLGSMGDDHAGSRART